MIGSTVGNYRIVKLLGQGGMGQVYLAEDLRLGRQVALKILPAEVASDSSRLHRFKREASSAATLNHPGICTIHEIGEENGIAFIAMEYIEGQTLRERISTGPMTVEEVLQIAIQMTDAMEEARKKGIVHRDLKPANIIITAREQVKILDFGLAKQLPADMKEAPTVSNLTESGVVMGTVPYMSPEQALGKPVDHRSDLFSFGIILYEMLTGRLPFHGDTSAQLLNAILSEEPVSVARYNDRVPDSLLRILQKCLEKKPQERYQTAYDLWLDLRRISKETQTGAVAVPLSKQRISITAGVAVLLLALIAFYLFRRTPGQQISSTLNSVVALPCKVYGPSDVAFLTDAVPNTLTTQLAKIPNLETKAPPNSIQVDKLQGDTKKLAELYKVRGLVVSSITAEAQRFVLNIQLVDSGSQKVIWSDEYQGTRGSYIELTRQAADGIRKALQPASSSIVTNAVAASNSEAELMYRRGKYFFNRYNYLHEQTDFDAAFSTLKKALELDPNLADAAADIAFLYVFKAEVAPQSDAAAYIRAWANRAVSINPRCSMAWSALVPAEEISPRMQENKQLEYALKGASFDANNGFAHQGLVHSLEGAGYLRLSAAKQVYRVDPLYLYGHTSLTEYLLLFGQVEEAYKVTQEAMELEPNFGFGLWHRALLEAYMGRVESALSLIPKLEEASKEGRLFPSDELLGIKIGIALQNRDAKQVAMLKQQVLKLKTQLYFSPSLRDSLIFFLKHGKKDESFEILSAILGRKLLVADYDMIFLSPLFAPLRGDPRLHKFADAYRKDFDRTIGILQQAKSRGELPQYLEQPLKELLHKIKTAAPSI